MKGAWRSEAGELLFPYAKHQEQGFRVQGTQLSRQQAWVCPGHAFKTPLCVRVGISTWSAPWALAQPSTQHIRVRQALCPSPSRVVPSNMGHGLPSPVQQGKAQATYRRASGAWARLQERQTAADSNRGRRGSFAPGGKGRRRRGPDSAPRHALAAPACCAEPLSCLLPSGRILKRQRRWLRKLVVC